MKLGIWRGLNFIVGDPLILGFEIPEAWMPKI